MTNSSRAQPRLVPWLDHPEWCKVRDLLYSADREEILAGLLHVHCWMDRGKVPTAIESTANFLEVILSDAPHCFEFLKSRESAEESEDEAEESAAVSCVHGPAETGNEKAFGFAEERTMRLAYNTAVIRFVNELADQAQKSLYAISIAKLAEQISLSRVFVDIRHEGTHDKMASLELLRWAAGEAVKWLFEHYWSEFEESVIVNDSFVANVHALLNTFYDQISKIEGAALTMASLEKSAMSRVIGRVEYLQSVPEIMRAFLLALAQFRRDGLEPGNTIEESIIRPLARQSPNLFYSAFVEVYFSRVEAESWLPWVLAELNDLPSEVTKRQFFGNLFSHFSRLASLKLFQTKLNPLWTMAKDSFPEYSSLYAIFDRTYSTTTTTTTQSTSTKSSLREARTLVNQLRYAEQASLEGWAEAGANWRPCPLGSIPQ